MTHLTVDKKLLSEQLLDMLRSNINEPAKSGLHNLLGEILDTLQAGDCAVINEGEEK